MSIKSIKVKNLLSFDELFISNIEDINCIVGKNNTGKSNLLKLLRFFYNKLEGKRQLPPSLNSKYSTFGTITITYDTSRIEGIVTAKSNKGKSDFFKHIYNVLFLDEKRDILRDFIFDEFGKKSRLDSTFELTLQINSDDSVKWLVKNENVLSVINYIFPFFDIEARHIDLYDWNKLWVIVSRLKSFKIRKINQQEIIDFFDEKISSQSNDYREYIGTIQDITKTGPYNYREKVLNYVKASLKGQTFLINEKSLEKQSDGTNSHRFIEIALELLVSLSRRDYISPTIYIDEPEVGLHPKRNEELIYKLNEVYLKHKKRSNKKKKGRVETLPKIIFATHSPNIVKEVIKLFDIDQQILHFSKNKYTENTVVKKMNSSYKDNRFLNIFSDNEARLFFSNFILFVEGETELEIFGNNKLLEKFPILKDIDVYKSSSNVFSSNINPDYSNTSIPYLMLFDADKIYSFQHDKSHSEIIKIKLENKNKNLYILPDQKENEAKFNQLILKYKKGFNKKYADFLNILKAIKDINKEEFTFNKLNFEIKEKDKYQRLLKHLRTYLQKDKVFFVHTTIEEVLINKKCENLFFSWLKNEYDVNTEEFLFNVREVEYKCSHYKGRKDIDKIKYVKFRSVINKRVIEDKYPRHMVKNNIDLIRHVNQINMTIKDKYPRYKVKKDITQLRYINPVKKLIVYKNHKYHPMVSELLLDYIRVQYFGGKFEILNSKAIDKITQHNKKDMNRYIGMKNSLFKKLKEFNSKLTEKQQTKLNDIFNTYIDMSIDSAVGSTLSSADINKIIKNLSLSKKSKTSGWATSFLNYAIDSIDKNRGEVEFEVEFKKYFGELYDIINVIKNKL